MLLYNTLTLNMTELSPLVYISVIHRHEDTLGLKLLYIQDLIQRSLSLSTSSYLTSPTLSSHRDWNCFLAFVNLIVCWLSSSLFLGSSGSLYLSDNQTWILQCSCLALSFNPVFTWLCHAYPCQCAIIQHPTFRNTDNVWAKKKKKKQYSRRLLWLTSSVTLSKKNLHKHMLTSTRSFGN